MSAILTDTKTTDPHTRRMCRHCGAPLIDARMRASGFCCSGCSYVYRLVHEHGLSGYYRIKDDVTTPADVAVFQPRDYSWLEVLQVEAEKAGQGSASDQPTAAIASVAPGPERLKGPHAPAIPELTLDIQGISCAGCVWLIERVFQQHPGARDIFVNAQYGTMRLRWLRGEFSAVEFARKLQAFGYLVGPAGEAGAEPESRGLVRRIGLCTAFALNVMLFSLPTYFGMEATYEWAGLFGVLNVAFGTLSLLAGGFYFLGRALRALRERALHIDLPIAVGIIGAYVGSLYGWLAGEEHFIYFDFVSVFIVLMLIGRWAQVAAVEGNRRRLLSQQPKPQQIRRADGTRVPPEQLAGGDEIRLAAGQTVPVEARLEARAGTFSLASINGEAGPRDFRQGQRVPAGAINVGRAELRMTALQPWRDSLLAQLLAPSERESARHRLLELIVRGYLIGIFVAAAGAGIGWWVGTGDAVRTWGVVIAVLVVSCPCAVALAFPLADEMATVALRRRGVFVRQADLWSKLARVRKLVFDKTGTLTLETPVLRNPEVIAALDDTSRSALYALVRDNPHPVSQSLLESLLAHGPVEPLAGEIHETIGCGVILDEWSLGRIGWRPGAEHAPATGDFPLDGHDTELARAGVVVARFRFEDATRPGARAEMDALRNLGFGVFILSGDRQAKVTSLARDLGLPSEDALGDLSPQLKVARLDSLGSEEALMLGDGANDSLAFDRALCRGTPVIHRGVLERKADFYYLGRGIGGLQALFVVNAIRRRTQWAILIFSVAYNVTAVGLAVAGHMNPLLAAMLMPISSLITLALVTGGMRRAFHG
jgi:P-type Cu2+ transporter